MTALLTLLMVFLTGWLARLLWRNYKQSTEDGVMRTHRERRMLSLKLLPPGVVLVSCLLYLLMHLGDVLQWLAFIITATLCKMCAQTAWSLASRIVALKRRPAHKIAPMVDEEVDYGLFLVFLMAFTLFFGWISINQFGRVTGFW
jgi:hypothetical protein